MVKKTILICSICLNRNYHRKANFLVHTKRLVLKKYCSSCNYHTSHKATR